MDLDRLSIGLQGSLPLDVIRPIAAHIEAAGLHALWLNDAGGDTLTALAAAAEETTTLTLATGVLPLDRRPAALIAGAVRNLPHDRVVIGVGSGGPHDALARVSAAVREIKATGVPVLVGALGPRMRHLGATEADGVLLSWLTPSDAADAMADLRRDGASKRGVLYARSIVDDDARESLQREASSYESYPSYAANFARLGIRAIDTVVDATESLDRADEYLSAVDELVLRAIVREPSLEAYRHFVDRVVALA